MVWSSTCVSSNRLSLVCLLLLCLNLELRRKKINNRQSMGHWNGTEARLLHSPPMMADPEPFGGSFLEDLKGWVKAVDTNTKSTWDLVEIRNAENWSVHVRMVVIHQGNCNGVWYATSAWIYGIICVFFAILLSINWRYRRRRRVHMMCSRAPWLFRRNIPHYFLRLKILVDNALYYTFSQEY